MSLPIRHLLVAGRSYRVMIPSNWVVMCMVLRLLEPLMFLGFRLLEGVKIMRIRMKIAVLGSFHNIDSGVKVGQVVDIDDENALRYINLRYAEAVGDSGPLVERAIVPEAETATLKAPVDDDDKPKALDEPEEDEEPAKKAPAKRPAQRK